MPEPIAANSKQPRRVDAQGRVDLKAMDWPTLCAWLVETCGANQTQAHRIYKAMWQDGVREVAAIPRVARTLLDRVQERAFIPMLEPELVLRSDDGTLKFLWRLHDGRTIESVLIPDGHRTTLCLSSQVGCAMACTFCLTGDLGLIRHLSTSEIANQALQVGQLLAEGQRITNLVFMGMGEPLHNLPNLLPALQICLDDHGLNFSHRRVTVSTVGLVPKMAELAAALPVNLAISLNATTEDQRRAIMPITRKHSMQALLDACRAVPLPRGKRIAFEYVMLAGHNDSLEDAARLLDLLDGIPSKVNLIPYNENPDRTLRRPSDATVKAFQDHLVRRGMHCTVRTTRGIDVSAACGQLGKAWEQAEDRGWLARARAQAGVGDAAQVGA